jgi:hypothetical protein
LEQSNNKLITIAMRHEAHKMMSDASKSDEDNDYSTTHPLFASTKFRNIRAKAMMGSRGWVGT